MFAPGISRVLKALEEPLVLSSPLSVESVRRLAGGGVDWMAVALDVPLYLLHGILVENLDRIGGDLVLEGAPVRGYLEVHYPELITFFTQIASGAITPEMLKGSETEVASATI